eukprot:Lankesteria_metandrocarpae@DN684_c0_g1_i1.p1
MINSEHDDTRSSSSGSNEPVMTTTPRNVIPNTRHAVDHDTSGHHQRDPISYETVGEDAQSIQVISPTIHTTGIDNRPVHHTPNIDCVVDSSAFTDDDSLRDDSHVCTGGIDSTTHKLSGSYLSSSSSGYVWGSEQNVERSLFCSAVDLLSRIVSVAGDAPPLIRVKRRVAIIAMMDPDAICTAYILKECLSRRYAFRVCFYVVTSVVDVQSLFLAESSRDQQIDRQQQYNTGDNTPVHD